MDPSSQAASLLPDLEQMLNEPQLEAVTHVSGPLLVLAGAGSGKTRVITFRIANLLATHRVPPYRILAVTFTNKAAGEMRARLEQIVGSDISRDLWVGTFHATCARLLRRYHEAVGLARDFVIYDEADQRALMARVLQALKIDDRKYPPKQVLAAIHTFKQQGLQPKEITPGNPFERIVVSAFDAFQKQLTASNAVDFDDLILHVLRCAEDPASLAGEDLRRRFDFVLVDEFQDANPVQYRLVRALADRHHNLCVVGDDDQSIYRWRGADVRIIRGFKHDFPGVKVVKLEENYRSTGCVVKAALGVIKPSPEREPKELFTRNPPGQAVRVIATRDERDEAAIVVRTIRQAIESGLSARDIAVFYRIHAQSRVLEEAMRAEKVPYQIIGGTKFFERAEIKDLLSYLRVLANPRSDVDLLRIINVPTRGIGQTTIDKIVRVANELGTSIDTVIAEHLDACGLAAGARNKVLAFRNMMEGLRREAAELTPRDLAERVLEVTGYTLSLTRENTPEADARFENLRELLGSLDEYADEAAALGETATLSGYLERVSLVSDIDQMQDDARVAMMTVHGAKGLEFSLVLVTGMEEDLFPYRSLSAMQEPGQLEEERRLGYVALTRARNFLYITHAATRLIFGSTRYCRPSRFIADLPEGVVEHIASPSLQLAGYRPPSPLRQIQPPPAPTPAVSPGERYVERDAPVDAGEAIQLARGRKVSHPRFGQGTVEGIEPSTSPPVVVVFFPGWGKKRILATFLRPV